MDNEVINSETENQGQNQEQNQEQVQVNRQPTVRERFATNTPPVLEEFEPIQEGSAKESMPIVNGNNGPSTYVEIITETDETGQPLSVLEVDLIISREKGEEKRRLTINFAAIENNTMVEKAVSIKRESFEELKKFFCQLDWNS